MLLPPSDLSDFNDLVTPVEVEAYDVLKYRSGEGDYRFAMSDPERGETALLLSPPPLQSGAPLFARPRPAGLPDAASSLPSQVSASVTREQIQTPNAAILLIGPIEVTGHFAVLNSRFVTFPG